MADRPLSQREREILAFLLTAPEIPDGDIFRRQAEVAVTSGHDCPCGCASIGLNVDPSMAPQARFDRRHDLVEASTDDIAGVHESQPLVFIGDDLRYDPAVQPRDDDLSGAIGLILWVAEGWVSGIEIWGAGRFKDPDTFPPAELFDPPQVTVHA